MGSELIAIVQVRKHSVITRCGDSSRDREKKWVDLRCVLVAWRPDCASGLDMEQEGKDESRISRLLAWAIELMDNGTIY